jgi:hypothetical protein
VIFSFSGLVLFGAITVLLIRRGGLKVWHAVVSLMAGFYLASSSLAPTVRQLVAQIGTALEGLHL